MQVTETKSEGLKREYKIAVPATDIEDHITSRLKNLARTVKLPGFRPGKAPVSLLRKRFGQNIMGEVLEKAVSDSSAKVMEDNSLRPAMQPKIEVVSFDEGKDLEYTMALEVLPKIEVGDFSKLELERLTAEVEETEIATVLERMAQAYKSSAPVTAKRKSKKGDIAVIDFKGRVGGEVFPGGAAEDYELELGSGSFIPGFEEQLTGAKAGDALDIKVTFPDEYGAEDLAGKEAVFEVTVKELREPVPAAIDDDLAKKMGRETLEELKQGIRDEHSKEYKEQSRQRLKRGLLDRLSDEHDFEVPEGMVEREFDAIWTQFQEHAKAHPEEKEDKSEDEIKSEFRTISVRRIRLGLLLSEVAEQNNIRVGPDDINKAMMAEARRYPGQEQAVIDYYRNSDEAQQQLRGPILEDKVVDFIIEMAKVTDKKVPVEDLMKDPGDDDEKPAKKTAGKAAPKKAAPKKAAPKKAAAKKAAPKKAAPKKAAKTMEKD